MKQGAIGAQHEIDGVVRRLGQDFVKFVEVSVGAFGDPARQNAHGKGILGERIRLQAHHTFSIRMQIPIRFLSACVHGNGIDGGGIERSKAEVQRQTIKSFEALQVGLQHLIGRKVTGQRVGAKVHL